MFLRDPITNDGTVYMKNSSTALTTIIGFSAIATLFAIFLVSPILEMITKFVTASGY
jgi:NADH-quinone oxidoreductase subunit N